MGKAYEPPLCIDCKYYSFDSLAIPGEEPQHLCQRSVKKRRSLITGEDENIGFTYDCKLDRYGKSGQQCGESARFFKEKE